MRRQVLAACFAIAAIVAIEAIGAAHVQAAGYYNLPGNFCQCCGHGFGAGYHAPLILGPPTCRGWCACNETRLLYPPAPCCSCYQCGIADGPSSVPGRVFSGRTPTSKPQIAGSDIPPNKVEPTTVTPTLPVSTVPAVDVQPTVAIPAVPTIEASTAEAPAAPTIEASTAEVPAPAVVSPTDVEPAQAPLKPLFDPPIQP